MRPIVVLFALPAESGEFRQALAASQPPGQLGGVPILVNHTGVGAELARRKAEAVVVAHRPRALVSAGFAGGLEPGLGVGAVVVDGRGVDLRPPGGCVAGRLFSADRVVELACEKAALGRETGAQAVDMETAAIGVVGDARGIPVIAVRTISDPCETDLPVPMEVWFSRERQAPRPLALVAYLLRHPAKIAPFARFVRGLAPARRALARALAEIIPQLPPTAP